MGRPFPEYRPECLHSFLARSGTHIPLRHITNTYVTNTSTQRRKVYVQDLVREHSKLVYFALAEKGGMVYICGSSGKMPQAVREALIEVFQKEGSIEREDAEGYLARMEKEGRYKQETW